MLNDLYKRAEELAGRPVEVEKLKDGKLIVLWMRFEEPPPKPGDTEEEALRNFIEKMSSIKNETLPSENTESTI